jgi:drug/metabolite transporter (DMT)-like permease
MLKESIRPLRWLLVMGGFVGTLVIIRPGGQDFN